MASQITGVSIVSSTVCSGADQRKHQSFASLTFVRGIYRWPMDSPHKGPVTRKISPRIKEWRVVGQGSLPNSFGVEFMLCIRTHFYGGTLVSHILVSTHLLHLYFLFCCRIVIQWSGPVFCLLLGVSSGCAQPVTGQVTSVTWPVIGWA